MQKQILKGKKAMGIGDIYPIVLTIAIVGILLGIVMMVMSNWVTVTDIESGSVTNETSAFINTTGYTLDSTANCSFNTPVITGIVNTSDGAVILVGNATVSESGIVTNATSTTWGNVKISYTYKYGGKDCEAMESVISDFTDFIPWIGIILLIVAAAIVLGIVIRSFAGRSRV